MTKKKLLIIWGLFLIGQLFVFYDYIFPIQWGQIKVKGLACTCPDEKVVNGQLYLRVITPEYLKKYDLDYSEIYVTQKPYSNIDPMGIELYIIKGQIIGKERVSENDPWNPKFRVDEWREVDIFLDWGVKTIFFIQLIWLIIILRRSKIVYNKS